MPRPSRDLMERVLQQFREAIQAGDFKTAHEKYDAIGPLLDMYQQYLGTPDTTGQSPATPAQ